MPFIQRQMRRIYTITLLGSLQFAGACWVALLAARFTWPAFCLKCPPGSSPTCLAAGGV